MTEVLAGAMAKEKSRERTTSSFNPSGTVTVPPSVTRKKRQSSAPIGMKVLMVVAEREVITAGIPPQESDLVVPQLRFVPVMVTSVPTGPLIGLTEVIVGDVQVGVELTVTETVAV